MKSEEVRKKFLEFFSAKGGPASGGEGHKIVPSSSLVPENDPSVLFTTAGMQQFKPYYTGDKNAQKDFGTLNTVSIQKCVRTSDIEEVGDDSHLTFFEMMGNFSFASPATPERSDGGRGGYFKKEAIKYAYEFITKEMGLKIDYVSIFKGDPSTNLGQAIPRDEESYNVWKETDSSIEIKEFGKEDNFWGPTGNEGPCGPTTEIYVNGVEIWNIVFNEYYSHPDSSLTALETKGVDTGMGFERLVVAVQKKKSIYETDLFDFIIKKLGFIEDEKQKRIMADHIKASIFLISDGITPSNTDRGYILRRLLRRVIRHKLNNIDELVDIIISKYFDVYNNLDKDNIKKIINTEKEKFEETLNKGLKQFEKAKMIDPFILFSTYGFPLELTMELAKERGIEIDIKDFEEKMKEHQEISRAGMEEKFKGGLAGHSEMEIKYHTATHLLHQALREILGNHVFQKGSNITPKRLRFDFSHLDKMTDEEKKKVEDLINQKIKENLSVSFEEMKVEEAKKQGALGVFDEKYGEKVKVYSVGNPSTSSGQVFSKEICGGPHVKNTSELGKFRIQKEEAVSAGVRRIKAILE